jgi:2-keto-4-pentenoate hydratase/2-oxohepta-3-ene-1,7-dioic acid hydratase in catechol pathway
MKSYSGLILTFILWSSVTFTIAQTKYIRYSHQDDISYGILEGDIIQQLSGDIFNNPKPTGKTIKFENVKLLTPCEPSKVLAVGLNYKSHLGDREPSEYPGLFSKYPTSIVGHEDYIKMPLDATELHYEGELVIVMGKVATKVSEEDAADYVFGVTNGNDVSERAWQRSDLQWIRSKAADTFGPIGPSIVTGLDYNNLQLITRLNGEVVQSQSTSDLIFNVEAIVSYISQYITLLPGDLIFTGTPGATKPMKDGDIVEIEIEGIGVLRNEVKLTK